MTIIRKYPTAAEAPTDWTLPNNALNAADGACANHVPPLGDTHEHTLKVWGFGFAIPAGATINSVVFNCKASCNKIGGVAGSGGGKLVKGLWVFYITKLAQPFQTCATSGYDAADSDVSAAGWTVNDLNAENFDVFCYVQNSDGVSQVRVYVDSLYVEVDYTPVPSGTGTSGSGALTLLALISTWLTKHKRKRKIATVI